MRVLFTASEAYPLVKTGGLGDVMHSLPHALQEQGADVRVLLPGYRDLLAKLGEIRILGWLSVAGSARQHDVRILSAQHPDIDVPLLIADCQLLFDRPGNPYLHPDGYDWPDNAERFTVFSRVSAALAMDGLDLGWQADLVHAHDWQTGLVPAFLSMEPAGPKTVFTIHNLAYGGHFSHDEFMKLHLPGHWWSGEGAEFYGGFSMLKAGLVYSDAITTVSPTYAEEICTPAFGYGMEGVLLSQRHKLRGILNGIDIKTWDPSSDRHLKWHFNEKRRNPGKRNNKAELLSYFGADTGTESMQAPVIGLVSRLVEQKGIDLVADAIPQLLESTDAQFVLVGAGHHHLEERLLALQKKHPGRVHIHIGYSEDLAHLIEAGSDMFLMPSRFEPCGLNQMYSLRYGTPPVVHRTGGLADTVVDTNAETLADGSANGFVMETPTVEALVDAVERAVATFRQVRSWQQVQRTGMGEDYGWEKSGLEYFLLYQTLTGLNGA